MDPTVEMATHLDSLGIFAYNSGRLYCFTGNYFELTDIPFKTAAVETFPHVNHRAVQEMHRALFSYNDTVFDVDSSVIAFTNCVYSLKTREFRQGQVSDYVTRTTGYPYIEPEESVIADTLAFFRTVFPDQLYACLAKISKVIVPGNLVVFLGEGCTGKSTVAHCIEMCLGEHFSREHEMRYTSVGSKQVVRTERLVSVSVNNTDPVIRYSTVMRTISKKALLMIMRKPIVFDIPVIPSGLCVVPFLTKHSPSPFVDYPDNSAVFKILVAFSHQ